MSSFNESNLSVLAYANNFTLWHYVHNGDTEAVGVDGYFNNASDMLQSGDRIILQSNDATRDITVTQVFKDGNVSVWLPGVFGEGFPKAEAA